MTTYGPDYLRRLVSAVDEFQDAFEQWMTTQHKSDHMEARGLFPTVWSKEGQDAAHMQALELDVAEAAGLAATAVALTGANIALQGIGVVDPISNWSMMRNPKAFISPQDVRMTAATVTGRLKSLLADAEADDQRDLPTFSPARMHEVVWTAAAVHWTSHQFRVAVREAAEGLTVHWKGCWAAPMWTTPAFGNKRCPPATLSPATLSWHGRAMQPTKPLKV